MNIEEEDSYSKVETRRESDAEHNIRGLVSWLQVSASLDGNAGGSVHHW